MYLCGCKLVSTQHVLTYIKKIYRQNNMNWALWRRWSIRSFELSAPSTRHLCSFNPGSRRTGGTFEVSSPLFCHAKFDKSGGGGGATRREPEEMLPNWVHARRRAGQQQHTHTPLPAYRQLEISLIPWQCFRNPRDLSKKSSRSETVCGRWLGKLFVRHTLTGQSEATVYKLAKAIWMEPLSPASSSSKAAAWYCHIPMADSEESSSGWLRRI